ncbi:hypothetical protein C2G38_2207385 [Gigaspora rosea]|uniref:Aconitase A/isopropylmalate dehydratase small subunit swivel domain-containing protein n=1 Tax=Gigaspora rosea TaxID=44941 RepID=A0A397ULF8_9GLOM|nr:hypothetical protein C2G38_2207385 [Gigaspora rosea]
MFFIEFPVAPRMMLLHALWRCNEGQAAGFEIGALGCSYCITVAADHAGNGESKGAIGNLAFAAIVAASSLQYSVTKSLADVIITGKVQRFEDNINTDAIIPAQFIPGIDDEALVKEGFDIVVGGSGFGSGSSREEAPRALKASGGVTEIYKKYGDNLFRAVVGNEWDQAVLLKHQKVRTVEQIHES